MSKKGKIYLHVGTMFGGKTDHLVTEYNKRKKLNLYAIMIKPSRDTRSEGGIVRTHNGKIIDDAKVIPWDNPFAIIDTINKKPTGGIKNLYKEKYLYIEEMQFFDRTINDLLEYLTSFGFVINASALKNDYLGRPFEVISNAIAIAHNVSIYNALCTHKENGDICAEKAIFTQMFDRRGNPIITEEGGQIHIGAGEIYEPRCREHFIKATNPNLILPKYQINLNQIPVKI